MSGYPLTLGVVEKAYKKNEVIMEWLLENWSTLLQYVVAICAIIVNFSVFVKTRKLPNLYQILNSSDPICSEEKKEAEMNDKVKKKLEKQRPAPTEFTSFKKDYVLDPVTNELQELETPINLQEKIESYLSCALDRALEKFMPKNVIDSDDVAEQLSDRRMDLAALAEAMEIAEDYRERHTLSDSMTMADIYAAMDKEARDLKKALENLNRKKEEVGNEADEKKAQ